jgi:hypothetical protein
MHQSGVSVIVYVSIRCISHSVCIHDWYKHYDWYTWLIHILWLTHLIHTYTITDTPDSYIHYDWYTWLIHTLSMRHLIDACTIVYVSIIVYASIRYISHSVCINQLYQSQCMHQSGVSVIEYVTIKCIRYIYYNWHTWLIHTLWLTHMIDTNTMTDTPDWYIYYECINQVCQS